MINNPIIGEWIKRKVKTDLNKEAMYTTIKKDLKKGSRFVILINKKKDEQKNKRRKSDDSRERERERAVF